METPESQISGNLTGDAEAFEPLKSQCHELVCTPSISAHSTHQDTSSWNGETRNEVQSFTPLHRDDQNDGESEEVLLRTSLSLSIDHSVTRSSDVVLLHPPSPLSVAGDSNGSPSTGSPIPFSSDSQGSPDSMGPSDCENYPVSPCHSPYYSRPGSPWPMFARPSFKKTRSPFWTTFRVKEFR